MLSAVYAAAARSRRSYYASHPHLRRTLSRPVISIGNIAVGGRAKTPLAAYVASRLRDMGERPAILSRGYGRRDAADGVVVVRDPGGIRADLDRAGDEPLMLARQLEGVAVLVSPDRYLAGRLAEHHFGCTVHVLDDGFQHFPLRRDADIVVIGREDFERPQTLPGGRLREPLDSTAAADALIGLDDVNRSAVAVMAGRHCPIWHARRRQGAAVSATPIDGELTPASGPIVAVAGLASPARFFADLRSAGWTVARELSYRDHHRYSGADVAAMMQAAGDLGAQAVLTTEKDLVRLLPFRPFPLPVAGVPLTMELDEPLTFDTWLMERVEARRRP
jgi:tetraacyldisaccharide 4'-kinase